MSDAAYFREQAQKCRRLARGADYQTAMALQELEVEYTAKAVELEAVVPNTMPPAR